MIRVPNDILEKLREIMPELRDESDANLVRVALRKFIYENKKQSLDYNPLTERSAIIALEEINKRAKLALEKTQEENR